MYSAVFKKQQPERNSAAFENEVISSETHITSLSATNEKARNNYNSIAGDSI